MKTESKTRLLSFGGYLVLAGLGGAFLGPCLLGECPNKLGGAAIAATEAKKAVVTETFEITGMMCTSCADKVTKALKKQPGVKDLFIDWEAGTGKITYEPGKANPTKIIAAIKKAGFEAKKS